MSLWRDEKYLRLLAPTLERFTQKSAHTFNFRCPLCGDSETKKSKARGYIFAKNDVLIYKCHNCSIALPFSALLKRQSRHLYDEYMFEQYRENAPISEPAPQPTPQPPPSPVVKVDAIPSTVHPLSWEPPSDNPLSLVRRWAVDVRKLPKTSLERLFSTTEAFTWLTETWSVDPEKAKKVVNGIPYLVQPLRLPDGTWYGAQLRPIDRKEYTTFRWSHEPLKVFGLDVWKPGQLTYVVEGPIDALFVPNAISTCGSDLLSGIRLLEDANLMQPSHRRVYVWDNEPRNKEIVRHIRTAVKLREHVVIWPRAYPKDINDMVRQGIDVQTVLAKRTFFGLNAELELASWLRP